MSRRVDRLWMTGGQMLAAELKLSVTKKAVTATRASDLAHFEKPRRCQNQPSL